MATEPVENTSTELTLGCVAINMEKRYGIITKIIRKDANSMYYDGIGFDGNYWFSLHPIFIASSVNEYMRNQLW